MIISIEILLYRIVSYNFFEVICKYCIAGYENRYQIVTNHPIYTPTNNTMLCGIRGGRYDQSLISRYDTFYIKITIYITI